MWHIGTNGYGWASSCTETGGYFLGFGYNDIGPHNGNYRSYGRQTRCLQE
ncbi:MAG: hypothetical protein K2G93_08835 [Rikenella sp.]|nr:hypothetical protein [Rikenella sp.]